MNEKICNKCGTVNEEDFIYCKNCGEKLTDNQQINNDDTYQQYTYNNTQPFIDKIEGVDFEDIITFTDKNSSDILRKFQKMELSNSKISWCWPAAILGFLFGPFGSALWFFYRKMYKSAIILSVIGAIISIIIGVLTFTSSPIDFNALISAIESGNINDFIEGFETGATSDVSSVSIMISELINEISSIISAIVCGLYGFYIYKKHTVNKIKQFNVTNIDPRYYKYGLSSIGGVSGGMLALGIFIMLGINYAITIISFIISIFIQ